MPVRVDTCWIKPRLQVASACHQMSCKGNSRKPQHPGVRLSGLNVIQHTCKHRCLHQCCGMKPPVAWHELHTHPAAHLQFISSGLLPPPLNAKGELANGGCNSWPDSCLQVCGGFTLDPYQQVES
jgi:hypothetical protein